MAETATEIVKLPLESGGGFVYLEATEDPNAEPQPVGRGEEAIRQVSDSFEAALEKVKPAAEAVVEAFRGFNQPDEIGLEFGLQFKSAANAFVLTGEGNASFKLSLKWTKKQSSRASDE